MRNRRHWVWLLVLAGCGPQPTVVFVDLDLVPLNQEKAGSKVDIKPDAPGVTVPSSRTIPGEPEKTIENLKADEKAAIRAEVEKETNDAIQTISKRLQDYYSREIDDYYKLEFAKLSPYKQALMADYLSGIRSLFEEAASKRGPLLTRLTFLTEFPPPEVLIPLNTKTTTAAEQKRKEEVRSVQTSIIQIDHDYDIAIRALESKNSTKIEQETERILAVIAAKQGELDTRASAEASRLVKRFSSNLSQRIFSRYTFQLKEIPTKTLKFPEMAVQPNIPRVTFDRNQLIRNERAELSRELEAFLSLNHYQRAVAPDGAKDITKEFIEWRTNLKSGHWEAWQKSSAQK